MLQKEGIQGIALLSVGFHLPRAKKLFKNYGVKVEKALDSEGVLRGRNLHYDRLIRDYHSLLNKGYLSEVAKEVIGTVLTYTIDPKGAMVRRKTLKTRHRG